MRVLTAGVVALASVAAIAATPSAARSNAAPRAACAKTYTFQMFRRAAITAYGGTKTPSSRDVRHLRRFRRCARHPWQRAQDTGVWHLSIRMNAARKQAALPMTGPVVASWFDDAGGTACGIHAAYGFATLLPIPCGHTVTMRGPTGLTVVATREDSGPYVGGRTFDLNPALKAALGCSDLCRVSYRIN